MVSSVIAGATRSEQVEANAAAAGWMLSNDELGRSERELERAMKFGYVTPQNWGLSSPQDVTDLAIRAEQMGFDSVWVNHHILNLGYIYDRLEGRPYYDALTTLTWIGALTERVRLGTTVLVLPYLNPIVLAKSVATLDAMSGGRVTLGVGVGMLREENEALGSDFATRGAYSDESIRIMRELWGAEDASYSGRFFEFGPVKFSPKPVQPGGVPILIGGMSRAAMRRCARLGDGWHPNGGSVERIGERFAEIRRMADGHGRDPDDIRLVVRCELDVLDAESGDPATPMIGTPDELARSIEALRDAGASEIVLGISTSNVERIRRIQDAFVERVIPMESG